MHGKGACMAGGLYAWQGVCVAGPYVVGHAWQGVYMVGVMHDGGVCGRGACLAEEMATVVATTAYWNAFFL